ncbi:unnamed protein product [Durusdinium trenchii]|uniref:Uncharacterized protein n=1 Tax=Durusdinium trenchii TaxID=1381693 RepID=A0ABP0S8D5_9DINO
MNSAGEIKEVIPFERAQILLENAKQLKNLNDQRKQLDAAQASFEQFVKASPNHRLAGQANTARGRILLEQARVEIWDGDKPSNEGNRDLFRQNARDMIKRAREIFKQAVDQHQKAVAAFPSFIPPEEKQKVADRAAAEALYIEAELDLAQCTYWEAQTHDKGTEERADILSKAAEEFEAIHTKYRSMIGGLYARVWQGKCFEEQDEIRIALGIYEEILGHPGSSTTMNNLKDRALRFRLICLNHEKRKDFKLTLLEGEDWLRIAKARSRTAIGLGIQWEMCLAQEKLGTDRTVSEPERMNHLNQALNRARTIARYPGELKTPATSMVQRLMVALNREPGDPKDFETANGNADVLFKQVNEINTEITKLVKAGKKKEAKEKQETLMATAAEMARLYDIALKLTVPDTNPILINIARLRLAYGLFLQKKYYDAAVVAEHQMTKYGEKYPEVGLESGFIAMTAFDHAYTQAPEDDRNFEGKMVADIAEKIAERWPESDRANDARNAVARIYFNADNLLEAAEWYKKIPPGTSNYSQAQVSAGKAYWRQYVIATSKPEGERPTAEDLNKWKAAAVKHLETGLAEAEKEIPKDKPLPDDLVGAKLTLVNIRNLDGVYKKGKDGPLGALELLTAEPHPVLKSVDVPKGEKRPTRAGAAQSREIASFAYQQLLRAHIGLKNLEEARKARQKLEEVAGEEDAAALTQVYIEFGRELEQELDRLRAANETTRLEEVRAGFEAFLNDLYNREDGQTFYSLLWIAETFTSLADGSRDNPTKSEEYFGKAADAYRKILTSAASDPEFVSDPGQIVGTKLRLASSLRRKPDYEAAEEVILDILKTNPSALDAQFEVASLYQEWASSGQLGAEDKFFTAIAGSPEGAPITIWGWAKMAQFLQRELFSKKDERLEKLHFDARYRLAQTQLQWGEALSDEEKSTEQLRRAQASVAGFQRISPRWPDEEYARFNQLYRDILAALGSPQVDLPRDLDGEPVKVDPVDDDPTGNQANPNPETPEPEESGGSNVFLMIVMLVFGGGAVAGLYFLAVGGNKKKYAKYETDGERPAPPPATDDKLTFPVEAPAAPEKKKEVQMPAFELNLSDGPPAKGATATADEKKLAQKKAMARKKAAQQKEAAKASGQKKAAQPSSAKQATSSGEKPKRKYTEEEIKKIKAARAAKAKAAKKKAEGAEKPKKKPEDS